MNKITIRFTRVNPRGQYSDFHDYLIEVYPIDEMAIDTNTNNRGQCVEVFYCDDVKSVSSFVMTAAADYGYSLDSVDVLPIADDEWQAIQKNLD